MHYSSASSMPAIDQTLALLELQDTILNRIRLESRLWSLRSELAVAESDENQAREAQVEAERAVEEAKKKTERAAEKGRTIKVELRFLSEQISEFDKEMAEYKAQLVKSSSAAAESPPVVAFERDVHPPSAAELLMAGAANGPDLPDRPHPQQNPIGSGYRQDAPSQQPIKQEYTHESAMSQYLRDDIHSGLPAQVPSAVAQQQSAFHDARSAFESFRPMGMASSTRAIKPIAATPRPDTSSSRLGRTDGWNPFGHTQSQQSRASSHFDETGSQYSVTSNTSTIGPGSHATITHHSSGAPVTDDASTDKPANPHELKSRRLIDAVTELTGKEPEYFFVDARTFFLVGPLAGVFSPSLKDPNKAASAHARKYGCDASGQARDGVRKQGGRWAMTLEAFEDYVLSHLRSPRFIKY